MLLGIVKGNQLGDLMVVKTVVTMMMMKRLLLLLLKKMMKMRMKVIMIMAHDPVGGQ